VARITLVEGDITAQRVDVVVNAANRSLLGGGGVDGAIHRRGGPRILAECRRVREERYPDGLPVGRAVSTTAGDLPAAHVIHVVGPVYGRERDAPGLLAACHTEALRLADELGARSIAFPAISTGAFGYPLDEAAAVAIRAVREAETRLEEIRFVLFDAGAYEAFGRALSLAGGAASSPAAPGSG
jgi:O-acetyl-ADP-ribose deacetylase